MGQNVLSASRSLRLRLLGPLAACGVLVGVGVVWASHLVVDASLARMPQEKVLVGSVLAVIVVMVVAAGVLLESRVINRVGVLARVVQRRQSGDATADFNDACGDEIGRLASDLRQSFASLARSEARYRTLVDALPDATFIECDGGIALANQAMARLVGVASRDEMVGRPLGMFIQGSLCERGLGEAGQVDRSDGMSTERWVRPGGDPIEVEAVVRRIDWRGHRALLVVARDLSQRRQVELGMRTAYEEAERLLASLSAILIGIDHEGRITRWNAAAERAFGIGATDAIGKSLAGMPLAIDWAPVTSAVIECLEADRSVEAHEVRFTRPGGGDGWLLLTASPSFVGLTGQKGVVLLGTDVTESRLLATQRQQGQKLESIGQLAAGIAHEINTPIQFIGDNLTFLNDSFRDVGNALQGYGQLLDVCRVGKPTAEEIAICDEALRIADIDYLTREIPDAIGQSLEGVDRVSQIVKAMKEFSHPDQGGLYPADLNQALRTTLTVARNEYKYVAKLVTSFDPDLPSVRCVISEINQVILNLIVNAAHAIEERNVADGTRDLGTITVTSRRDGGFAEIAIADTGAGIPEQAKARIFDPFFTTKPVGKGTGQGLYLAHATVVRHHHGTIAFHTRLGVGTTFFVRLPLDQA